MVGSSLVLAATAEGYTGDHRYPLPAQPSSATTVIDVAALADGSVLVSDEKGVTRRLVAGAGSWRRVPRLRAYGMTPVPAPAPAAAGAADGILDVGASGVGLADAMMPPANRILAIDADDDRVVQWTVGAVPMAVAGSGEFGFGGDGGPATGAKIGVSGGFPYSRGVAALAAGGFLLGDTANNRVRYVDAMGIIRTVAGNGREAPRRGGTIGDGGLATSAVVRLPVALAVLADGSYVVLEGGTIEERARVRRVTPEGLITTIASGGRLESDGDLTALPDGRVLMIEDTSPRWLVGSPRSGPAFVETDVAGRDLRCAEAAGNDGASLLIAACSGTLWWLPQDSRQRRAAAIRARARAERASAP